MMKACLELRESERDKEIYLDDESTNTHNDMIKYMSYITAVHELP